MGALASLIAIRGGVACVQTIEHGNHRSQQGVIVLLKCTAARHDGCKSRAFRNWNAADINVVDERSQPGESGVLLQVEAGQERVRGSPTCVGALFLEHLP